MRDAARRVLTALTPDGDEAQDWAEDELAEQIYQAAQPTAFDRAAKAVGDFIASLFSGDVPAGAAPWFAVVAVLVVLAVIVIAFVIWGLPRGASRSRTPIELFGETDERSAGELRSQADAAAAAGDWDEAIVLRFRALARGLVERTIVDPEPGATVHRFARVASRAFPGERAALDRGADAFDDVRYLRRPGTEASYRLIADLDGRLAASAPVLREEVPA